MTWRCRLLDSDLCRIYWIGPMLGSLLAAGFFWFIKACEYETANPVQDFDDLEASVYNAEEDLRRPSISHGDPALRVLSNQLGDRPAGPSTVPNQGRDVPRSTYNERTRAS